MFAGVVLCSMSAPGATKFRMPSSDEVAPDARIIKLETAITSDGKFARGKDAGKAASEGMS